jgi:hypothetical protein
VHRRTLNLNTLCTLSAQRQDNTHFNALVESSFLSEGSSTTKCCLELIVLLNTIRVNTVTDTLPLRSFVITVKPPENDAENLNRLFATPKTSTGSLPSCLSRLSDSALVHFTIPSLAYQDQVLLLPSCDDLLELQR